ncbi:MAG: tetratricopeptide repeat protein, partial [Gemmatimonadetes bacterium]|nr:tetratricopeptide repeat protein [Gemmatimonadota bacterium]
MRAPSVRRPFMRETSAFATSLLAFIVRLAFTLVSVFALGPVFTLVSVFALMPAFTLPAAAQTVRADPSIEAIRLANAGESAAAIPLFEEAFSRSFSWIVADKAGAAYAEAGEAERGERFFRGLTGRDESLPAPILFAIARIHAGTERALDEYEASLRRDPAQCLVWRRYIDDANEQKELARARAFLETAAPSPERTFARGHLARREGDHEASRALLEEALAAGADPGWVIASLGAVYMAQSEWERAIDSYGSSLSTLAARGDIELAALVEASRGYAAMRLGRYEDAFDFFREAVRGTGATGRYRLEIQYAAAASECAIRLGRYEDANEWTDAARRRAREVGSPALEYYAIGSWADYMIRTGEFESVARELEPLATGTPDERSPGMLRLLLHLARAKKSAGDLAGAARWYEELAARSADEALLRAAAYEGLAETHLLRGQAREAERCQRDAIAVYREARDPEAALQAEADLARVFESQGRYQEALDALFAILPEERATQNAGRLSVRLSGIANLYDFLGNYREALRYRTEALEAVEQTGDSLGMAQERANLGLLQLKAGSYAEADSNLERSLRLVRSLG